MAELTLSDMFVPLALEQVRGSSIIFDYLHASAVDPKSRKMGEGSPETLRAVGRTLEVWHRRLGHRGNLGGQRFLRGEARHCE